VQETSNAFFTGNFDGAGAIATSGTVTDSAGLIDTLTGVAATAGAALTDLENAAAVGLGLVAGDTITLTGRRGGADITASFVVGADVTTLGDLATAIEGAFGIVNGSVAVDADGSILITGDLGTGNAITTVVMNAADAGGVTRAVFDGVFNPGGAVGFTEITAANGDSYILSGLDVFDSLGNTVPLTITFTRTGPNTVDYFADSPLGTSVGSGTITYDNNGQFLSVDNALITIDRSGSGSIDPLDVTLDFGGTTFLSGFNTLALASQDGFPIGALEEFFVGIDGTITGSFSNGLTQILGQVALANFSNQGGLLAVGDNLFVTTGNSGEALTGVAGSGGRGTMVQGFLEGSNTDMAKEFTNIIITQRGFQANARTISTADALLEEVISLTR
jgi:flagellar hook protein FlgE